MRLGAHMPTRGGIWKALERGASIGCEAIQLFVKNNMQWFGRPFAAEVLTLYGKERATRGFHCVFGHTGYLINLGASPGANRDHSLRSLIQEIELAAALQIPFLVMHPGAHLGAGDDAGLRQIVAGLDEVFRATKAAAVRVALENTAGQGSCLGHRLTHLATIFDRVAQPRRLGVCLDTAHFFAAGYDLRTPRGWDRAIAEAESAFGLEQVLAFHLNDSKTPLGSRVDRHAHIGQGHLGRAAFRHIVSDPRFQDVPGCIETPKSDDLHEDLMNLTVLRELRESARG